MKYFIHFSMVCSLVPAICRGNVELDSVREIRSLSNQLLGQQNNPALTSFYRDLYKLARLDPRREGLLATTRDR